MNSGLYACAGASAIASAAACAKRFEEPITNESNVYLGLIPAASGRGSGGGVSVAAPLTAGAGTAGGATGSSDSTRRWTRYSAPVASLTAARINSRKWPSIHSRVKSFGTLTTRVSPWSSAPAASPSHVWNVVSFSAPRNRAATSVHRLAAVTSSWGSTWGTTPGYIEGGAREYQRRPTAFNEDFRCVP